MLDCDGRRPIAVQAVSARPGALDHTVRAVRQGFCRSGGRAVLVERERCDHTALGDGLAADHDVSRVGVQDLQLHAGKGGVSRVVIVLAVGIELLYADPAADDLLVKVIRSFNLDYPSGGQVICEGLVDAGSLIEEIAGRRLGLNHGDLTQR